MAAMVATQHGGLWQQQQRRSSQVMNMSPVGMPGMIPTSGPPTRPYQQSNQIEMGMPMYPQTSIAPSMNFQSGAYGFDLSAMNQFPVHQPINFSFQPQMQHAATFPQTSSDGAPSNPIVREARNSVSSIHRSPSVKSEPSPIDQGQGQMFPATTTVEDLTHTPSNDSSEPAASITFSTEVDCLMRAIQMKTSNTPAPQGQAAAPVPEPQKAAKARKRYQCSMPNCNKAFYQKTHLEIHTRAHTGIKPFVCKEPSCGQRFSQLGNLKTHERRHTGERPYQCEVCGKSFAQRGNVRAHKIVHQQIKPFTCKLDDCGKQFTQLGNLKSHQNKFHSGTLRYLTQKFVHIREGDSVTAQDKELWEYFASLYKNSNKGIKGRGKDRRIWTVPSSSASSSSYASNNHNMSQDDRSSRSSSYASAQEMAHHHNHAPSQQFHGFEEHQQFGNMVFPER